MSKYCIGNLRPGDLVIYRNTRSVEVAVRFERIRIDGQLIGEVINKTECYRNWFAEDEVVRIEKMLS